MKSLRELYKIGNGPSSSHTMGPQKAAEQFLQAYPGADAYEAVLFGSLARTGRGHRTDWILKKTLEREGAPAEIRFDMETREEELPHPNTFTLTAKKEGKVLGEWRVMSVGGGAIQIEGQSDPPSAEVYALSTFAGIGSACAMAVAGLAEMFDMEMEQIEYAAEVALEHHLGLTCDPIAGLVQIPCIERNAVAAMRAINALSLANFLTYTRKISFDLVVRTMYETGKELHDRYRETSEGGLEKLYR